MINLGAAALDQNLGTAADRDRGRRGRTQARASKAAAIARANPRMEACAVSSAKSGSTRLPAATKTASANSSPGWRMTGK